MRPLGGYSEIRAFRPSDRSLTADLDHCFAVREVTAFLFVMGNRCAHAVLRRCVWGRNHGSRVQCMVTFPRAACLGTSFIVGRRRQPRQVLAHVEHGRAFSLVARPHQMDGRCPTRLISCGLRCPWAMLREGPVCHILFVVVAASGGASFV